MSSVIRLLGLVVLALVLSACSGRTSAVVPGASGLPPMRQDAALPASAMTGAARRVARLPSASRATAGASLVLTWTYLPSSAVQVAYGTDGTLWALSTGPAGPDKSIWQYSGGTWINVPGYATKIAPAPDGSLWAITSQGSLYHRVDGTWAGIGGQAQDLAVDTSGNVFVVASGGAADNAIWEYTTAGTWRFTGGYGARLAARPDGLLYAVTAAGALYASGTAGATWTACPGAVLDVAPVGGGAFYALGYTTNRAGGALIYQFTPGGDCASGTYQATNGFGTAVAYGGGNLAVIGTDGAIYIASSAAAAAAGAGQSITVVDYFTGLPIAGATATVDGVPTATAGGVVPLALGAGLHPLAIAAPGYATYNGAVHVPAGAASRTVKLFPVTPELASFLALVNADRQANGQNAVQLDDMLTIAAFDHAVDMGVRGYFAHFDPLGLSPNTRSLLLGSMLMAAENLAAGFGSAHAAEAAFVDERANLAHQSPADCLEPYPSSAGHYCNLVWPAHNVVGLAAVDVSGSPYGTYFDQEFGDLYGFYDPTVIGVTPAPGATVTLQMAPAGGASVLQIVQSSLAIPIPIPLAQLNADPTCASTCPAADGWYPAGAVTASRRGSVAVTAQPNRITFYGLQTSTTTSVRPFVGYSAYAAFWAGATQLPTSYADARFNLSPENGRLPADARGVVPAAGPLPAP